MTNSNQKTQEEDRNKINPIAVVVAGVVGVVAGAVAMSNEKNREKIKQGVTDAKDKLNEKKDEVVVKMDEGKAKAVVMANNANDRVHSDVKNAIKVAEGK